MSWVGRVGHGQAWRKGTQRPTLPTRTHGIRCTYTHGCRCLDCREAEKLYKRQYRDRKRQAG